MFYLSSLTKDICIYPKDITSSIKTLISEKIIELEGKVIGNYGYIISIVEFNQASKGKIDNETGTVNYKVIYKAITFKPIKGEILDIFPSFINEHGFFCKVGPLQIFISQHMMIGWKYNPEENIWAQMSIDKAFEAGPESEDYDSYESETEIEKPKKSFVVPTNCKKVEIGKLIRIEIIAARINSSEITSLGKIF